MANSSIFNNMLYGHQNNSIIRFLAPGQGSGKSMLQQHQAIAITRTARNTIQKMMRNSLYGSKYFDFESYYLGPAKLDINPYLQEPVLNVAANSEHPTVKAKLKELEMVVRLCHAEELAEQQKKNKYHTDNKERLIKQHIKAKEKENEEQKKLEDRYWVKLNLRESKW